LSTGPRTDQGFDFLDLSCAIIGRVPRAGLYLDENRRATSIVDVTGVPESVQNSETFFPVLGQLLGREYSFGVPLIVGLEDTEVSQFRLRALGATASTAGSVRMFHMLGHTPEAEGAIDASRKGEIPVRKLTTFDLLSYTNSLSKALPGAEVSAVCLGAPHISFEEFALIADLLVGRSVKESVTFSATTSRATVAQLEDRGLREVLEDAGMVIVADTCSYLGLIDVGQKGVCMTNSGKWAYYAPMGYPVTPVLGSLQECVESAVVGKVVHLDGFWSDAR